MLSGVLLMSVFVLSGCGDSERGSKDPSISEGIETSAMTADGYASEYSKAVENDDAVGARLWGARYLSEVFPDESADGLRVDPHMFGPFPENERGVYGFATSVLVRTTQQDQAQDALARCSVRFRTISYTGGEFESSEEFEASLGDVMQGTDDDIPKWVSDPIGRDDGVALVFDSPWMFLPMKVTMINVLRQELQAAGVTDAYITSDVEVSDAG